MAPNRPPSTHTHAPDSGYASFGVVSRCIASRALRSPPPRVRSCPASAGADRHRPTSHHREIRGWSLGAREVACGGVYTSQSMTWHRVTQRYAAQSAPAQRLWRNSYRRLPQTPDKIASKPGANRPQVHLDRRFFASFLRSSQTQRVCRVIESCINPSRRFAARCFLFAIALHIYMTWPKW